MNRIKSLLTALALAAAGASAPALAIPDLVSYAARVESGADPFNGTAAVSFRIFGVATGGTSLWSEDVASIVVADGELVHDLGSVELLDGALLERDALFLELTFNGEVLLPRVAMNAAPFALRARDAEVAEIAVDAERLGGRDAATYQFSAAPAGGLALSGTSFSIATSGVTSAHIADAAIGTPELANSAVTTAKLAAAAVSTAILTDLAVVTAKLADGAVSLGKLAANSVDGSKIVDGSVATADIAVGAVNSTRLANNAVQTGNILDGGIAAIDLASNSVTEAKVAAGAITSTKLRNGVSVFDLPSACGEGLTPDSTCRTKMCGVLVTRDGLNTILGVVPLFSSCANRCSATSSESCSVSQTTVAGTMVGN